MGDKPGIIILYHRQVVDGRIPYRYAVCGFSVHSWGMKPRRRSQPVVGFTHDQLELLASLAARVPLAGDEPEERPADPDAPALSAEDWKKLNRVARALGMDGAAAPAPGREPLVGGPKRARFLTPTGARIARQAAQVVHELEVLHTIGLQQREDGRVPFTCFPAHLVRYHHVLLPTRPSQRVLQPIDVSPEQRLGSGRRVATLLRSGQVLLAIGPAGLDVGPDIEVLPLYRSELCVAVPEGSRLARRPRTRRLMSPKELEDVDVVVAPAGHLSRTLFDEACKEVGARVAPAVELADVNLLHALSDGTRRVAVMLGDAFGASPPAYWPRIGESGSEAAGVDYCIYWSEAPYLGVETGQALVDVVRAVKKFEDEISSS